MLTKPLLARNLKVEIFEAGSAEALAVELQAWFDDATEQVVVGIEFESEVTVEPESHIARVLYTE